MKALSLVMLLLAGCATAKQTYLPNGKAGYTINCSGSALSWDLCFQKAGELCGRRGYDVIDQHEENGSTLSGTQAGVFATTDVKRTMLMSCK